MSREIDKVNSTTTTRAASILQKRIEYDSDDNIIYLGTAPMGKSTAENYWTINKFTWVAGTVSGFNLTVKQSSFGSWEDRLTLTYS